VPWTTADRYPAEDIWQRDLSAYLNEKEKAAHDKAADEVLGDPEKTIKTLVTKLTTGAPKAFGRDVDGKPASQVLEERLRHAAPRACAYGGGPTKGAGERVACGGARRGVASPGRGSTGSRPLF
jgi:hypothetical protein